MNRAFLLAPVFLLVLMLAVSASAQPEETPPQNQTEPPQVEVRDRVAPARPAPRPAPEAAQSDDDALPVSVEHVGDDPLGLRLAFTLKERFAASPLFRLVEGDAKKLRVRIETQSEFPSRPNLATVYSLVWQYVEGPQTLPYFLDARLGLAGAEDVYATAQAIAGRTDRIASQYGYLFE
jgi:hypothetical protein